MSKRFYCLALFLVMLLSITCVAASEDINSDNDALANVETADIESAPIDVSTDELSAASDNEIVSNDTEKLDPNLNIDITPDDEFIEVVSTVEENATGNVSIQVKQSNEENYTDLGSVEIENGTATWTGMVAFDKGNYTLNATYSGDDAYYSTSVIKEFEIAKFIPELNVNITTDHEYVKIIAALNENATGTVTIRIKTFEEENFTDVATIEVENGTAVWADQVPFDKGEYVATVKYSGDENYFDMDYTDTFTIEKSVPDFNVTVTVDDYRIIVNATVDENATGTVTIDIKTFEEENFTEYALLFLENGTAVWNDSTPFEKGDYVIYTAYSGDENYFDEGNTQTFTIEKELARLQATILMYDEFVTVEAYVDPNATGTITFAIKASEEENYTEDATLEIENGTAIWEYATPLEKGEYNVKLTYSGDENYFGETYETAFEIEKSVTDFNVTVTVDDCFVTVVANVDPNATGSVSVKIRNSEEENYTDYGSATVENGTAIWDESVPINKGDYEIVTTYSGDENYFSESDSQNFTIEKQVPELNVEVITDDEFVTIVTSIDQNATGTVTIRIKSSEEENYTEVATIEIENGTATWADQVPFDKGEYSAYVTYSGDENYFKFGTTVPFEIEKSVTELNVTVTVDKCFITVNATVNPNATGNVTIKVKTFDEENFTEYATVEIENGTAIWADMVAFDKGDYVIYTTYNGDENFFGEGNTQTFTIEKQLPEMYINTTVNYEYNRTSVVINVTLPENATGTVSITNNRTGETSNFTLNGTGIIFEDEIVIGDNIFIIGYSGDDYYFDAETTIDEIIKVDTFLTVPAQIKVKYGETVYVLVQLSERIGQWVSPVEHADIYIVVNNVTYNGTIEYGEARINFTAKLVPDEYIVDVVFEGDDRLENTSTIFPLIVKKAKTKITAKDAKYKLATKTKKYKIRLTNKQGKKLKNKKVYLKVNGKTYKVKTSTKGIATFKIKNLTKRAKYIALITYKGSKYYKEASQKVTLTVK